MQRHRSSAPSHSHGPKMDWVCAPGDRPRNDDGYFERMARTVFQSGLSWALIDRKWPAFQRAFAGFSVDRVAAFGPPELRRLMADTEIVRNERKIMSILSNAQAFEEIRREHGSFARYLDSLGKADGYAAAAKELSKRFAHLGPSTARFFLYAVGEPIPHDQLH